MTTLRRFRAQMMLIDADAFSGIDKEVLQELQVLLDDECISRKEGMKKIAEMSQESPECKRFEASLVEKMKIPPKKARAQLLAWQSAHKDLQKVLDKQEKIKARAKQSKSSEAKLVKEPIWRCGVCGRADKPWIVCSVAPYIAFYRTKRMH